MKDSYLLIGYPEPIHVYLGTSTICAFTLFPKRQNKPGKSVNKSKGGMEWNEIECVYDPNIDTMYDIEFRHPFKEDADGRVVQCPTDVGIDEWYLAKGVSLDNGKRLCSQYLDGWCDRHGLKIL